MNGIVIVTTWRHPQKYISVLRAPLPPLLPGALHLEALKRTQAGVAAPDRQHHTALEQQWVCTCAGSQTQAQ